MLLLLLLLVVFEASVDGHGHAWSAETALRGVEGRESLVDCVQAVPLVTQTFGGGDGAAIDGAEEHQT